MVLSSSPSSSLVNGGPCSLSHNRSIKSLWYPALSWFFCLFRVAFNSARWAFTSAGQWMHSSMWLGMCEKLLRRWSAEEEKNRRSSGVPVLVEKEKTYISELQLLVVIWCKERVYDYTTLLCCILCTSLTSTVTAHQSSETNWATASASTSLC